MVIKLINFLFTGKIMVIKRAIYKIRARVWNLYFAKDYLKYHSLTIKQLPTYILACYFWSNI